MRLTPAALARHLRAEALAPAYLIAGDEPLQALEAGDALRARARALGHADRVVLDAGRDFDWAALDALAAAGGSLFGERRLIELRLAAAPPAAGAAAIERYLADPPPDAVLLIHGGALERRALNAAWVKAVERRGVLILAREPDEAGRLRWLRERLAARGLRLEAQALAWLSARVEGNLLAAAQEVDKLALLHAEPGRVVELGLREVAAAAADSARYTLYDLIDAAVAGQASRALLILDGLAAEGVAAPLVVWALAVELRKLRALALRRAAGEPPGRVFASVWAQRREAVAACCARLRPAEFDRLLALCAQADRINKGLARGRPWDALQRLVLALATGRTLPAAPADVPSASLIGEPT